MNACKTIGNGITFHYMPTDKFTTNYFSLHFVVPLRAETASGYSLLAKLFKKGCRAFPNQASLAKRLEELYASSLNIAVSKLGEKQVISLGLDMLSDRFVFDGTPIAEEASGLLCAILTDPYLENGVFSSAFVEREKLALKDQLRAAINDKNSFALKRCREIMCEGEAYATGVEGTEEAIDACTPASLYALYLRMLREAAVEIFYIGRESEQTAKERVLSIVRMFGDRAPVVQANQRLARPTAQKRVTETVDAVQGKLAMGFRTGLDSTATQQEKDALTLLNLIYGLSPVSKLFMNVREKRSLCYYCASRNDNHKGVLFVYSGVENKDASAAEEEILLQMEELKHGHITEEEILCAKEALHDMARSVKDSPVYLEQWYLGRAVDGDARSPEQVCSDIDRLLASDVQKAASRITLDTVFFLQGTAQKEADHNA